MSDGREPTVPTLASGLHADSGGHFIATMRFELLPEADDRHAVGAVVIDPYLQVDGRAWPNASTLLTLADILIGRLASHHTAPRISVTADLGVRLFHPPVGERLEFRARLRKVGRTVSVGDADLVSASGELVGTALGTFQASPRPVDEMPAGFPLVAQVDRPRARTLSEQVGISISAPGVAEISALGPDLMNATEGLQGGLVALLGEQATYSALGDSHRLHVIDTLYVLYVAASRLGPFRATAELLASSRARSYFRVEVRDLGRDRLTAIIETTTRALEA